MDFKIIDAHAHLWLYQDTEVEGKKIKTLRNGRSLFMGEIRQMIPPFMIDGRNTAEIFLSNMDYAQVSAAVITQEYIDGLQNEYLWDVQQKYPSRFLCCGMADTRLPDYFGQAGRLIDKGFRAIKIPAQRLITEGERTFLTSDEIMRLFALMEEKDLLLSVDLADGDLQVAEMREIIKEYPRLRIAIGHFGMVTRSGWQEQIRLARNPNVRIESGGITWLFNDEFYPFEGAVCAIREAADIAGWDKLMWGSDYPRTITAITYRMSYDFVLKSRLLTDEQKALFLGMNAERFYGFRDLVELPYVRNMSE
ncbi:MAG: amidohydrolase [Dysgonamonadaceae bacterium]|jgi:predicted TIM-barrel fold metal-dependent hydrolase|nr:amidohydrolase [Dysgonamonadaceae bacterium]